MSDFEFLSADDKPALTAIQNEAMRGQIDGTLKELGYVVHNVESHEAFPAQFAQVQYEVMVIEDAREDKRFSDNDLVTKIRSYASTRERHLSLMPAIAWALSV